MHRSRLPVARRALATAAALISMAAVAQAPSRPDMALVERGRYLVQTSGCNDCHTAGYNQALGRLDEKLWLTGDTLGWRGPWGTSYAPNLRLYVRKMTRSQWLATLNTMQPRPPMPWFNLRAMSKTDQSALYEYLKFLGPAGQPAPAWVPPHQVPAQPFVQFPG